MKFDCFLELDVWSETSEFDLKVKDESVAKIDHENKVIEAIEAGDETSVSVCFLALHCIVMI